MFKKFTTICIAAAMLLCGCSAHEYTPGVLNDDQKESVEDRIGSVYEALKTDNASLGGVTSSLAEQYGDSISPDNTCLMGLSHIDFSMPNPYASEYDELRIDSDVIKPYIYSTLGDLHCTFSDPVATGESSWAFTVEITGTVKDYNAAWIQYTSDSAGVVALIELIQSDGTAASEQFGTAFTQILDGCETVPYSATAACSLLSDGSVQIRSLSDAPLDGAFSLSTQEQSALLEELGVYALDSIYEADPEAVQGLFTEDEWAQIMAEQE